MMRRLMPLAAFLAVTLVSATAQAQEPDGAPGPGVAVPLSVDVTISRYQGDELVSSLPYVLAVTAYDDATQVSTLRVGADVPLWQELPGRIDSYSYRGVFTVIDCSARRVGDDRYEVNVIINESSVYVYGDDRPSPDAFGVPGVPFIRSFESSNTLVLRDGQSQRYTAAADRLSGETIRVDVMLTVLE